MNTRGPLILFVLVQIMLAVRCSDPVQDVVAKPSFAPLQVGSIYQLVYPRDSTTLLIEVFGTAVRADGRPVYAESWMFGTSDTDTSYYLLDEGYYVATELDTALDSLLGYDSLNPFSEQRLGMERPEDGQEWKQIPGQSDDDLYRRAEDIGLFTTPAGTFPAFAFHLLDSQSAAAGWLTTIFAQDIGWVATYAPWPDTLWVVLSYARIGGRTYGALRPERDPALPVSKRQLRETRVQLFDLLGKAESK